MVYILQIKKNIGLYCVLIFNLTGKMESGKTLFLTFIGEHAQYIENRKVFSNFELTNIPFERFDYEMLAELPEYMENGVILMDETQIILVLK